MVAVSLDFASWNVILNCKTNIYLYFRRVAKTKILSNISFFIKIHTATTLENGKQ